jgi:hypothetical protein
VLPAVPAPLTYHLADIGHNGRVTLPNPLAGAEWSPNPSANVRADQSVSPGRAGGFILGAARSGLWS